jgi:hypothetical protein
VEVSVSDTGIGIAPEDQEKVFEESQVGTAEKKAEDSGWATQCQIERRRGPRRDSLSHDDVLALG